MFDALKRLVIRGDGCNYTAIAFAAMNRTVPRGMARMLKERGGYEDVLQTARLAAVEAASEGLSSNQAFNLASRRVYQCMKDLGWRRENNRWVRQFSKMDIPLDESDGRIYK